MPKVQILVVDDNHSVCAVVKSILTRAGFDVVAANGGMAALKCLEHAAIHLVLADVEMPGVDGFDLCTMMKTHPVWAGIPVLLMTGRVVAGVPARAKSVGAADLLGKPFGTKELIAAVRKHVGDGNPLLVPG